MQKTNYPGLVLWLCAALFSSTALAADRALFWSISQGGEHRGYLLGTIHSEDPRVLDFSAEFLEILAANDDAARGVFRVSLVFLFAVFLAMLLDLILAS